MTPFCVLNTTKNALQIMSLAAYASETNNNNININNNNNNNNNSNNSGAPREKRAAEHHG